MACEDQINTEDLINAKTDAVTLGEVATSRAGAVEGGAPITTSTNRFGEVTDTIQGRLDKMNVLYDDPIRDWSAGLLVSDLRAHRYPATTGDIYIPTKPLPFTTGGTFNTDDWTILQGLTTQALIDELINDLSQAYEFATVADMTASAIVFSEGKKLSTGGTQWVVKTTIGASQGFIALTTSLGAFPINDLFIDDFGGVGDSDGTTGNGTDNTTPFKDAADLAITTGNWIAFSGGKYRFGGSPYLFTGSNSSLFIRGVGSNQMDDNAAGSTLLLDTTTSFMELSPVFGVFRLADIECEAIAFTKDRPFFDFTANTCSHTLQDVTFQTVEKPIVYRSGVYFQNASLTNVSFRNSGTIHSETQNLVCTLYVLNNINHEGVIPDNTEQVLCSLIGIRNIQATNFLLEGARRTDFDQWIILDIGQVHNADWTKYPTATFNGIHLEFSGAEPDALYDVRQTRGTVVMNDTSGFIGEGENTYALFDDARLVTNNGFTNLNFTLEDNFFFSDGNSRVELKGSGIRLPSNIPVDSPFIILDNCWLANSPAAEVGTVVDEGSKGELFRYMGELFDPEIMTSQGFGGSSITHETSATYGRTINLNPFNNVIDAIFRFDPKALVVQRETVTAKIGLVIPAFTGNAISVFIKGDNTSLVGVQITTPGVHKIVVPATMLQHYSEIEVTISLAAVTAITQPIEIFYFELLSGGSYSGSFYTPYPSVVQSFGSVAPNSGSHALGDNVSPNGGVTGFHCTVAGSPGTWVAY